MPAKLDHIGIVVANLEAGIRFYSDVVGLGAPIVREIPELSLRLAFFASIEGPIIELVEFSGKGELAHGDVVVAIEVDDLDEAIARYKAQGVHVYDQPPTPNLPLRRGWIVKKHGHGPVIELCPRGEVARWVRGASPAPR